MKCTQKDQDKDANAWAEGLYPCSRQTKHREKDSKSDVQGRYRPRRGPTTLRLITTTHAATCKVKQANKQNEQGAGVSPTLFFFVSHFFYGARTTSRAKSCRTWRMPHLISARKSKDCRTQENHGLAQKTLTFYKLAGKRMMLWSVMPGRKAPSRTSRHTLPSSHNKNEQMQLHKHARQRWDAD